MRPKFTQSLGALGVLFHKGTFLYHLEVFPTSFLNSQYEAKKT